ncbi:iron-containing alcohol dehydrogenase [uncultured Desulfovibrio sp.]|uniref:iron-containing alcohol dehydrogenase n=1 Tax=uncultured Desulfovibrio sp. TaxID=167968 RepID=UPI0025F559A9|nr:iron-containing alcohol dehydrogenase [uncultured Desulfovibrio sp.]
MFANFRTVERVLYGNGVAARLGKEAFDLGARKVALITDKGLVAAGIHLPLMASLEKAGIEALLYDDTEKDPSPASIEKAAAWVKESGVDMLVGLGGGSALDSTKATSVLATNEAPMSRYFGLHKVPSPCLPTILVPTTAGTGSEMTSNAVLNDPETNSKMGTVSDYLYARLVLLDPELTLGLPPFYTAITGLDAIVHGIESFVNLNATDFTDALNIRGLRMLVENIREAYANGGNLRAREQMLYGAAMTGMAFSNTQNGIIHALGMSVSNELHIPHGLMMAVCAPMGISFNALAAPQKFATIAEILGSAPAGASVREKARSAAAGFAALMDDLGIRQGLSHYGIKKSDLRAIAEKGAAYKRLMDGNPRKGTADDLERLLEEFF